MKTTWVSVVAVDGSQSYPFSRASNQAQHAGRTATIMIILTISLTRLLP